MTNFLNTFHYKEWQINVKINYVILTIEMFTFGCDSLLYVKHHFHWNMANGMGVDMMTLLYVMQRI